MCHREAAAGAGGGAGGGAGYRIKNKNPTQRCGEKPWFYVDFIGKPIKKPLILITFFHNQ